MLSIFQSSGIRHIPEMLQFGIELILQFVPRIYKECMRRLLMLIAPVETIQKQHRMSTTRWRNLAIWLYIKHRKRITKSTLFDWTKGSHSRLFQVQVRQSKLTKDSVLKA